MPRDAQLLVFVGIRNSVVALDDRTGQEVWRAKLHGGDFVTVLWDGEALIAANHGEIYRLDPRTGAIVWHNGLEGLGRGVVVLATSRLVHAPGAATPPAFKNKHDKDAKAAGAAAGGG